LPQVVALGLGVAALGEVVAVVDRGDESEKVGGVVKQGSGLEAEFVLVQREMENPRFF